MSVSRPLSPQMEQKRSARGMLAVGVEPHLLRACVMDRVEQEHRLLGWIHVERSAHTPLTAQLAAVVRRLGLRLGRRLWNDEAQGPFTAGDDVVAAPPLEIVGAAVAEHAPLPVWTVGLTARGSLAALHRALTATQSEIVGSTTLSTLLDVDLLSRELSLARPQLLLFAGGYEHADAETRGHVVKLATVVSRAVAQLPERRRPGVIYAGNSQVADAVCTLFADAATAHVQQAPNVQPEPAVVRRGELTRLVQEQHWRHLRLMPGIGKVAHWVTPPLQLTSMETAFAQLVQTWRDYHDLPSLHGIYVGSGRRLHAWSVRSRPDMGLHYAPGDAPVTSPPGWPPVELFSGDWVARPSGVLWWDQSGLAPLVATLGHVAPEAVLQVLRRDIFRRLG